MKLYKADAIVLKARDMREADKLLTLYSYQHGKIRAVAHGVAKPSSRKRGAVQPFCYSKLLLYKGRELDSVSQAEVQEMFMELRMDLLRLSYAHYLCELVDGFVGEGEPQPELFTLLLTTMHLVNQGDVELAVRAFETKLLYLLGIGPQLTECTVCGGTVEGMKIKFSPVIGGVLCPACAGQDYGAWSVSRGTLEHLKLFYRWEMSRLRQLKVSPETREELRKVLQHYIQHHLERRIRSKDFIRILENINSLYKKPGNGVN